MNDDLISRKTFIEELKLYCNRTFLGEITAQSEISIGELSTIIKNLPVAYDVDMVCKDIEKIMQDDSIRFVDQAVNRAKKIVKNGVEK